MNPFRLAAQVRPAPLTRRASTEATPVPWRVVRRTEAGLVEVEHCGSGPLHSVRFSLAGAGLLGLSLPRTVWPGERLVVRVCGPEAARARAGGDALLVLRWFQPSGEELLWPIAL